jgi:tritrans,polycis-undecaprenyl-diphosphate synthase [geranylgeranyl-diphosphate specific]
MARNIPRHVGIIPDGNRRFARRLMRSPWKGHEWGSKKLEDVFKWSKEAGIKTITFYTLSLENLNSRPKRELDFLMKLAKDAMKDIVEGRGFVHEDRVRVNIIGNLDRLPEDVQLLARQTMDATKGYRKFTINLAVAYGGRQELVDAVKGISLDISRGVLSPEQVSDLVLRQHLLTNGQRDPDLIIRTGYEKRLSNFLLFQSAYSELAFVDCFWPEFSKKDFDRVISDYQNRERRFGK